MTYQISYFSDPAMTSRLPDSDDIPDAALARYPAPSEGGETAFARHSQDRRLDRYGYGGQWSRYPRPCAPARSHIYAAVRVCVGFGPHNRTIISTHASYGSAVKACRDDMMMVRTFDASDASWARPGYSWREAV